MNLKQFLILFIIFVFAGIAYGEKASTMKNCWKQDSRLELISGLTKTFRTKGHPKAKGVDFSISFPDSWSKREGYGLNVIQFFQSCDGEGPLSFNLIVKTLESEYEPTKEELKEFFSLNDFKRMIPPGSTFVGSKNTTIAGLPGWTFTFDMGFKRFNCFAVIYKRSTIVIHFTVEKMPNSVKTLDDLQKQFFPTFTEIVNTLVLHD